MERSDRYEPVSPARKRLRSACNDELGERTTSTTAIDNAANDSSALALGRYSKRLRSVNNASDLETTGTEITENILEKRRTEIFDKLLISLGDTDSFTTQESHNFFLVYAHDNEAVGRADDRSAKALLGWLQTIRSRGLSDKSPLFVNTCYTREEGTAAAHDVLSNQFCLLPSNRGVRQTHIVNSVDKVILCWSEVIERYLKDEKTHSYIKDIEDCYFRAQEERRSPTVVQEEIRTIQATYRQAGFHHVTTELAFLKIRSVLKEGIQSIIPIILNGDEFGSSPYVGNREPVFLKALSSPSSSENLGRLHGVFFKLLQRLYEGQAGKIAKFQTCYNTCVETLPENSAPEFSRLLSTEISKCMERVTSDSLALLRELPKAPLTQETYLETLNFQEINYREQDICNAEIDSCSWIKNHQSYINWRQKNGGILGIRGKPGSGKSTLLKSIYKLLQSDKTHDVVQIAYFFHSRGAPLQHSEIGMYRTLLYKLLNAHPEAGTSFHRIAEHKRKFVPDTEKIWDWSIQELQQALTDVLLEASKTCRLRIFVDALDEAGIEIGPKIAANLRKLNKELLRADAKVSICYSCRYYPNIAVDEGFDVKVDEGNCDDISNYVSTQLTERLDLDGDSEQKQRDVKALHSMIVDKAAGVFMWIALIVPLVEQLWNDGNSSKHIQEQIIAVPSELEGVYQHIITNVIKQSALRQTLHLMQWVYFAREPLSVMDMRFAIASEDGVLANFEGKEEDRRMKRLVNSLTGGLAEVISHPSDDYNRRRPGTIQFIHQSVNDFLSHDEFRSLGLEGPGNFIGKSHDRLCRSCISYIKLAESSKDTYLFDLLLRLENKKDVRRSDLDGIPFASYAFKYWMFHAGKAEQNGVPQQDIITQFEWPLNNVITRWSTLYCGPWRLDSDYPEVMINRGTTLFHIASGSGLYSVIVELLNRGVDINERDADGCIALHYAASGGDAKVVAKLLSDGRAEFAPIAENGTTPLILAAQEGHSSIVQMLIVAGDDINTHRGDHGAALHAASARGNALVVQWLLLKGADINAQGGNFGNALQAGAYSGSKDVVSLLIDVGADINAQGGDFGNALQAGAYSGSKDVVSLLIDVGADINTQGGDFGNALQAGAASGSKDVVSLLLDVGADINAQGGDYGNALQAGAASGSKDVVSLLLNTGADVNAQGGLYGNALKCAKRLHLKDVIKLLEDAGAK